MAKVKLGNRPKNFKLPVKFPMLDGTPGIIEVNFKYRTKKEFGAFVDELMAAAKVVPKPAGDDGEVVPYTMEELMEKTAGTNAEYILQVADGWNIDGSEFNLENARQLCDEIPGAAIAIIETYRLAVSEGRLGN